MLDAKAFLESEPGISIVGGIAELCLYSRRRFEYSHDHRNMLTLGFMDNNVELASWTYFA